MPDQPDWASQVADQIERVVGILRDRTTRPALTIARSIVYGIIAGAGGITALILVSIVLIRFLTELTNHAWIAFLITSGIFLSLGAFFMYNGAAAAGQDLGDT